MAAARRKNGIEVQIVLGTSLVLVALAIMVWALTWPLFSMPNLTLLGISSFVNLLGAPLFTNGLEERERLAEVTRARGFSPDDLKAAASQALPRPAWLRRLRFR